MFVSFYMQVSAVREGQYMRNALADESATRIRILDTAQRNLNIQLLASDFTAPSSFPLFPAPLVLLLLPDEAVLDEL